MGNLANFEDFIASLVDDTTKLRINQMLAKRCDQYVPYNTGRLSQSGLTNVTPEGITYDVPYAEEQYYGIGIRHNLEHHPKATAFWDRAMMQEQGDEVAQDIVEIIQRRAKELYGK